MKVAKDLVYNHDYRDQVAVNQAVKALNASMLLLPQDAFPSGQEFFSKYQYYWDRKGNELKEWLKSRQRLLYLPQQLCERSLREGCAIQGDEDVLVGCEWRVQWWSEVSDSGTCEYEWCWLSEMMNREHEGNTIASVARGERTESIAGSSSPPLFQREVEVL